MSALHAYSRSYQHDGNENNRILVVDDDPTMQCALQYILENDGYSVSTVSTFEDVKEIMQKSRFNLALVDLVFSSQSYSGFDIIKHIDAKQSACKIIVITGFPSTDAAVSSLRLRVHDFFSKPIKPSKILSAVRETLSRQTESDPSQLAPNGISLSKKEQDVLFLLYKGLSYHEIAGTLHCSISTVQTHIKRIYKKLGVHSRSEAVHEALLFHLFCTE